MILDKSVIDSFEVRNSEPASAHTSTMKYVMNSIESPETQRGKGLKQMYFILWTMGENFPAHQSFADADLKRHENYMRQAFHEGRLLMAALFENGSGFITLVEAETEYEIHKFVRNHPDVADKRLQARIKSCKPVFWKNF